LSPAGFIAINTSGSSPVVSMSVEPKLNLKGRDAEQGALRRADLGREVGKGREVVARQRCGERELPAGQLHPVPLSPAKRTTTDLCTDPGAGCADACAGMTS